MTSLDPSWRHRAACHGMTDAFFPTRGTPGGIGPDAYDEARSICARCEVADACLEYALTPPYPRFGMWAGRTQQELRPLRTNRERRHVCHLCATSFTAKHHLERYCSDECRNKARTESQRRYEMRRGTAA